MTPTSGSVSSGNVSRIRVGDHSPLRALPPWAQVRAVTASSVLLVVAGLSPHHAWQQPILRLADTAIGVAVGLAAAWLALRVIRPGIRPPQASLHPPGAQP